MRKILVLTFLLLLALIVYWRSLSLEADKEGPGRGRGRGSGNVSGRDSGNGSGSGGRGRDSGAAKQAAIPVEVLKVIRASIEDQIRLTGEIEAWRTARVTPRIGGLLLDVLVRPGDRVKANETLIAEIDDSKLTLERQRSLAALKVAKATLAEKQEAYREARGKLEREKALFADKVTSRETLDAVEFKERAAVATLELAKAQVERAEAELALVELSLGHCKVKAPIDGLVSKRLLDGGEEVSPSRVLVEVVDLERLRVVGEITESDYWRILPKLEEGKINARVEVDQSKRSVNASLRAITPVFSSATRTARLELTLNNPDNVILPGMFARVTLLLEKIEDALLVPVEAVCERDESRGVFVVESALAHFETPSFGIESREYVQALDTLELGDELVTLGNHLLTDESRVKIVSAGAE